MLQFKHRVLHLLEEAILFLGHVWRVNRSLTSSLWGRLVPCLPAASLEKGVKKGFFFATPRKLCVSQKICKDISFSKVFCLFGPKLKIKDVISKKEGFFYKIFLFLLYNFFIQFSKKIPQTNVDHSCR